MVITCVDAGCFVSVGPISRNGFVCMVIREDIQYI